MNERLISLIASRQATPKDLEGIDPAEVIAIKSNPEIAQFAFKAGDATLVSEDNRTLRYVWTDESVDSDGDIISLAGWPSHMKRFDSNPAILWSHDNKQAPIGKAVAVNFDATSNPGRATVDIQYAPKNASQFADTIYQLAKGGFVKATSAGFRVLEVHDLSKEQRKQRGLGPFGIHSKAQELLEISNVSLPANANALRAELKLMVDRSEVDDKVRREFEKTFPLTEQDYKARLKEITRSFVDFGRSGPTLAECIAKGSDEAFTTSSAQPAVLTFGKLLSVEQVKALVEALKSSDAEHLAKLTKHVEDLSSANTRLVSALSDLTKRIALMGADSGAAKAADAKSADARESQPVSQPTPDIRAAGESLIAAITKSLQAK